MVVDFLGRIYETLGHERQAIIEALVTGQVKDYPAYQMMVGKYRGLELAESAIRETAKKFVEEDEE